MDTEIFEKIGFTPGETRVYLALAALGESTIGPLSKKAKVTPGKVYPILEKLKEKGLVTHIYKGETKYFQVLNPRRIIDFLNTKQREIDEQKQEVNRLIPTIESRKEEGRKYAATYETFNGIKTLYDKILKHNKKSGEDFIAFTLGEEYKSEEANLFFKNYDVKRKALGINMKILGLDSQKVFLKKEFTKNGNVEFRFLKYSLPTGVIIFGDNVVNLLWHDTPTAFLIHSKENADAFRKFFYDMWAIAQK